MEAIIIVIAIFWIGISLLVASLGKDRKIGEAGAFWVSFLTSPIIGLLVVIASDKIEKGTEPLKMSSLEVNSEPYRRATKLCQEAEELYKVGELDNAINKFEEAFTAYSRHPIVNYNLACCYSLKLNAVLSLKHLNIAIRNGYNKFDTINTDTDLKYLREQDEFKVFSNSGFDTNAKTVTVIQPPSTPNKYELLEKINRLKQDGALTQEEFEKEKAKILSIN